MVEPNLGPTRSRLHALDALRLLAALSVVLFHYTSANSPSWGRPVEQVFPALQIVTIYGATGVYLFFMISGFVVLMSAWGRTTAQFIASRAARLYPAYWLGVLLTGSLLFFNRHLPTGNEWPNIGPSGFFVNFTMFQTALGVNHVEGAYWTLWVELQFYIVLAGLVLLGVTRNRVLVLCALWPVLGALSHLTGMTLLTEFLQPQYAPFFAIGMLIFLIRRDGWSPAPVGLLLANLAYALNIGATVIAPGLRPATTSTVSPTVVMLLIAGFTAVILLVTLTPVADLEWKWLTAAGALTYPLYLLHDAIGLWLISLFPTSWSPWAVLSVVVFSMLVAAYLVNRFVEKPIGPRLRRAIEHSFDTVGARRRVFPPGNRQTNLADESPR